jgi:hypothetical protein
MGDIRRGDLMTNDKGCSGRDEWWGCEKGLRLLAGE